MSMLPQPNLCNVALDDDSIPETIILDDIGTPRGGSLVEQPEVHNLSAECEECVSLVGTQAETLREVDELHQGLQKGIAELGVGSIVLTYDQKVAAKTLGHKLYTDEGKKALEGWDRVLWKNRKQCNVVDWAFGEGSPVETLDSVRTDSEIRNAVGSSGCEPEDETGEGVPSQHTVDAPGGAQQGSIDLVGDESCPVAQPVTEVAVQDKETAHEKSDGQDVEADPHHTPRNFRRVSGRPSDSDTPSTKSEKRRAKLVSAWEVLQSNHQEPQEEMELEVPGPGQPGGSQGQPEATLANEKIGSQSNGSREEPESVRTAGGAAAGPSEGTGKQAKKSTDEIPALHNSRPGRSHWACTGWVLPPDPEGEKQAHSKTSVHQENQVEHQEASPSAPPPVVNPTREERASTVNAISDSEGGNQGDLVGRSDRPVETVEGRIVKSFPRGKPAPRLRTPQERQEHKNKLLASNFKKRAKVLGVAGIRGELTSGETAIGLVRKAPPKVGSGSGSGGNETSGKPGLWHRVLTKGGAKDGGGKKDVEIGRNMWRSTLGGRSFDFPGSSESPPEQGNPPPCVIKQTPGLHPTPLPAPGCEDESGAGEQKGGSSERGKGDKVDKVGLARRESRDKATGDDVCDLATPLDSMCPEFSLNPNALPAPDKTPEKTKWKRTRKANDSSGVKKPVNPSMVCEDSDNRKSPMSLKEARCAGKTLERTPPSSLKDNGGPSVLMSPSRSPNRLVDTTILINRGQDLFARESDGEPGNVFAGLKFVVTGFGADSDEIRSKLLENGGTIVKSCGGPCAEEGPSSITLPDIVLTFKGSRTSQYLACVSRGCGAVTPKWIDDCLSSEKLLRADPVAGHVVLFPRPHLTENAVFEGMRVYIHGDDKFQKAIGCVMQHGGAVIMSNPESRVKTPGGAESSAGEACVDVIVTREIPKSGQSPLRKEICSLQRLARRLGVPVKDKEWAVNAILEGLLDFHAPEATPGRRSSARKKWRSPASARKTPPSTSRLVASKSPKERKAGHSSGKRKKGTVDSESNFDLRLPKKERLTTVSEGSHSAERGKRRLDLEASYETNCGCGDSLSTRHPKTPMGVEQVFVAETPESSPPNLPRASQPKKQRPCSPSDFASCKLTWIGNPVTNLDDDGVALHRDFYLGFLLRGKEIKVNDFVELFPAPGERRARVVRLEALWSERPQGGEERMLARCRRFYWPQEVCVPVESLPNEVFSTDHIEDMVSLRAIVQKCSVKLMDVHETPHENCGLVAGNYRCRLHYHQNEGTVAKTRLGLWKMK